MTSPQLGRWATALLATLLVLSAAPAIAGDDATADTGSPAAEEGQEQPPDRGSAFDPTDPEQVFRDLVFPVVGSSSFSRGFGACRDGCTREHKGIDILSNGWKGVPVVAAHDGVVTAAGTGSELSGCWAEITAADGWSTIYIHLNTDLPGTDREGATCLAPGIEVGSRVSGGTLIGWVGDSGNAEDTVPNLHFEIRNPDDISVDPWVSLRGAERINYRWVGPRDVLELSVATAPATLDTVYVVDTKDVAMLALPDTGATWFDVPIVPLDSTDPGPAFIALRELDPTRIIIVSDGEPPASIEDLSTYAPLVDFAGLPKPSDPEESTDGSGGTPDVASGEQSTEFAGRQRLGADWFTLLIAGNFSSVGSAPGSSIDSISAGHRVIVLNAIGQPPSDIGTSGVSRPDRAANRSYLWWNTAEGWQFSQAIDDVPNPGLAYMRVADANEWTLAFLTSLATAPPMPLWHFQSTSRATRSL